MGKFADKKQEILNQSIAQGNKKTSNISAFNELGTALINEVGYETEIVVREKGEYVKKTISPVDEFRQATIGFVAKKAGCDKAEADRLTAEVQFPTLPLYPVVSEMVSGYLEAGKRFPFLQKDECQASLVMTRETAKTKEAKKPSTGEIVGTLETPEFNKIKAQSTCPKHRVVRKPL